MLVPTWNGAELVEQTLRSLVAQDYPNLEVIVCDDASTDDTWERCLRFAADARFSFHRQDRRRGWADNISDLVEMATGDLVFIAPQDDLFAPSYARSMVDALEQRPDAVLAFAHTSMFGRSASPELRTGARSARPGGPIRRGLRYVLMLDRDRAIPFRGVTRIAAIREVGGLRWTAAVPFAADVRWLFRLNLIGPFVVVPEELCRKRDYPLEIVHGGNEHAWAFTRRAQVRESLLYAREIRAARLSMVQRGALLLGVTVRALLVSMPGRYRLRAQRLLARIVG